jgi:gentisate 1,2-dioxygenase
LEQTRRPKLGPVLWRAQDINAAVQASPASGRGSVALSHDQLRESGAVAPGLSLTIQSVQAGARLPPHRHSFWHLYTVLSGSGGIVLEDDPQRLPLAHNDWIFIPAWCAHALDNSESRTPLLLAALQNLPQNAAIGSLLRQEQDDAPQLIYANTAL